MVAEEDEEVESGPLVAVHFDMWHFGDAAVEVELRTNADGCGEFVRPLSMLSSEWKTHLAR